MVRPEELGAVEMLAALPGSALEQLAQRARPRTYLAGDVIFHEGDIGRSLFIVRHGVVKVVRPSHDEEHTLQTLGPGTAFGELAVLNSAPRLASVIALEHCDTIEVAQEDLEEVLDSHPAAVRAMLGTMARSLTLAKEDVSRQNQVLEHAVEDRTRELRETQLEVIRRLGQAAESRDDETGLHITRMSRLSYRLGLAAGMSADEAEELLHASPMHDIGKIGIPDRVLLKPGKLDPEEWEVMKTHTVIGARILEGSRSGVVQMARDIAMWHHEWWDGSGYPDGLSGEDISLPARVCAVCDVFDALISERPYKRAWPLHSAMEEIERHAGTHFDPRLARTFVRLVPELRADLTASWQADLESARRGLTGETPASLYTPRVAQA